MFWLGARVSSSRVAIDHGALAGLCCVARAGHVHQPAALWLAACVDLTVRAVFLFERMDLPVFGRQYAPLQTGRAGIPRDDLVWSCDHVALSGTRA